MLWISVKSRGGPRIDCNIRANEGGSRGFRIRRDNGISLALWEASRAGLVLSWQQSATQELGIENLYIRSINVSEIWVVRAVIID